MMNIRDIAYNLIIEWDQKFTYPNLALKNALRSVADERDRRFISALVYGVVERKITLDHFISQVTDRPISKMDAEIRCALRMGIYQMYYMSIPASAACNTTVELVKKHRFAHSSGFVNAILRKCDRERESLLQLKKADYSVRFSIAPALVDLLLEQYGKETFLKIVENITSADNSIYLFHNLKRGDEGDFLNALKNDEITVTATEVPHLFKSERGFSVEKSKAYRAGWYHIIGKNSAKAASFVPKDATVILDLCAAPGGKTFAMAALTNGSIRAFDIHPHKIDLMDTNIERLGHKSIQTACMDASIYNCALDSTADFVLCDVPCSGLGIMGKKPDIKYKEYDSRSFTDLQYKILENAACYLRSGGQLVYSTCTLDRRENEQQIQRFLNEHKNFSLDISAIENGCQTFLPQDGEDGFFISVLRKA